MVGHTRYSSSHNANHTCRLQDETARLEDELTKPAGLESLLTCFVSCKANSFENLLDPLLKICRLSTRITIALAAKSAFFKRVIDRLANHGKAVVRLNLLRVLRTVCDVHPNRAILVERYGLYEIVRKLSEGDGAVLVRELAREIVPALKPALRPSLKTVDSGSGVGTPKAGLGGLAPKKARRTASETSAMPTPGRVLSLQGREVKPARTKLGDFSWQSERRPVGSGG